MHQPLSKRSWMNSSKISLALAVIVYLDDVLIFADNEAELEELTHKVLQRFLDLDLFLCPEKCTFNRTSVEYLGIIISEGELRMDPVKLEAVCK